MAARKLTRWQKAGALVPMGVLVVAWGAALGNSGLATASDGVPDSDIPDVPATAFEQPASVQQAPAGVPAGVDQKAGAAGTVATLSTNGIPSSALAAYRRAETLLGKADKACHLPWTLVAAIGRVESNHGRSNGNSLDTDGIAQPGIYGVPLDGNDGRAKIGDTDSGSLDKNSVYDLAVGPMQFIPGTWKAVGVDSDGDGSKNPQSINDAATSAGIYLCAGEGDMSKASDAAAAVKRYNNSDAYVDLVLKISAAYANGDFTKSPDGISTSPVLTSRSNDQSVSPAQRDKAARSQKKAERKVAEPQKSAKPSTSSPTKTPGSGGGSNGGAPAGGSGGGSTPKPSATPLPTPALPKTLGGGVQDGVKDTPLAPITKPVTGLLSWTEANLRCGVQYPLGLPKDKFDACVYDLTH
ncbi:MAG: lytic transglycosylase domain-containing protein [Aeromicrobium sp.]